MSKKIFDIIPPGRQNSSGPIKETPEPNADGPANFRAHGRKSPDFPAEKMRKSRFLRIFVNFLIVLLFILVVWYGATIFYVPNVKVEIWPKIESQSVSKNIIIDSSYKEGDVGLWLISEKIPGTIVSGKKIGTEIFNSSGKAMKEEKARGIVKIYNAYSGSSQTLVSGTRLVSDGGKLFKTAEKAEVPGRKDEKGKIVPGELDVNVLAGEAGADYNIGPSTFSIPGFVGTPKYTAFYGKSFSAMAGGLKGEVAQVTQADLDRASDALTEKLKKELEGELIAGLPKEFILVPGTILYNITDKKYSANSGDLADSFSLEENITATALVFKAADMNEFAKRAIGGDITKGKNIDEKALSLNYSIATAMANAPEGEDFTVSLNTDIKFGTYPKFDLSQLEKSLLGKSLKDAKTSLESQPGILKVKINAIPIITRKIPENTEKVELKVNI